MSEQGHVSSLEPGSIRESKEFVKGDLVCTLARAFVDDDRVSFKVLPDRAEWDASSSDQTFELHMHEFLCAELDELRNRRVDVLVFLDPQSLEYHVEGLDRTWDLYAELVLACRDLNQPGIPFEQLRSRAYKAAEYFKDPEHAAEFHEKGLLSLIHPGEEQAEKLDLLAMNPLYTEEPKRFQRWAPVPLYSITRLGDVNSMLQIKRDEVSSIQEAMYASSNMIYDTTLPYLMEGDIRYAHPGFKGLRDLIAKLQDELGDQVLVGDVTEMTYAVYMESRREWQKEEDWQYNKRRHGTIDELKQMLAKLGFLLEAH